MQPEPAPRVDKKRETVTIIGAPIKKTGEKLSALKGFVWTGDQTSTTPRSSDAVSNKKSSSQVISAPQSCKGKELKEASAEDLVRTTRKEEYIIINFLLGAMGLSSIQIGDVVTFIENYVDTNHIPIKHIDDKQPDWLSVSDNTSRVLKSIKRVISATTIQSKARGIITRRRMKHTNAIYQNFNLPLRNQCILGILSDEKIYGKKLEKLVSLSKILNEKGILSLPEISKIFSNIGVLWEIHQILLLRMEAFFNHDYPDITGVGAMWIEMVPFLSSYGTYIENSVHAVSTHQRLLSTKYKSFISHLDEPFLDLLSVPCTRIEQYCGMIEETIRLTPKGHSDFESLFKAIYAVKNAGSLLQGHLARAQNRDTLLELQRKLVDETHLLPENLAANGRTYIDKYFVQFLRKSKFHSRTVHLCHDLIFIVKGSPKEQQFIETVYTFAPTTAVSDKPKEKEKNTKSSVKSCLVCVANKDDPIGLVFQCKDTHQQTEIISKIEDAITKLKISLSVVFGSPIPDMISRTLPQINLSYVNQPVGSIRIISSDSVFDTKKQTIQREKTTTTTTSSQGSSPTSKISVSVIQMDQDNGSPVDSSSFSHSRSQSSLHSDCESLDILSSALSTNEKAQLIRSRSHPEKTNVIEIIEPKKAEPPDVPERTDSKPLIEFDTDRLVPPFLVMLVTALEENIKTKGIYRVSALDAEIQELRSILDEPNIPGGMSVVKVFSPHTIADVFKLYFRQLPSPLLTHELYSDVITSLGNYDDDEISYASRLRESLMKIPLINYAITKFLAKHLCRVAAQAEHNLMNAVNLAIVFGPSLLYPAERTMADSLALPRTYSVVQCLINQFSHVFGEKPSARVRPWEQNTKRRLRRSVSLTQLEAEEIFTKNNKPKNALVSSGAVQAVSHQHQDGGAIRRVRLAHSPTINSQTFFREPQAFPEHPTVMFTPDPQPPQQRESPPGTTKDRKDVTRIKIHVQAKSNDGTSKKISPREGLTK